MSCLVQNSDEWLEWRKGKIGASDAPIIMGVSPWQTPYDLWCQKLSLTKPRQINSAMQRGHDLEDKARALYEYKTGYFVLPQVREHFNIEYMIASLDGITIDGQHAVEIKCAGKEDHNKAICGEVPEKYYPQLQHQIEVCNLQEIDYFSFDGQDGVIVKVPRNSVYITNLKYKQREFWNNMQNLIPPQMTERDYVQRNDDLWNQAASEWLAIRKLASDLEDREQELKAVLISMSQGRNSSGAGIKVSKVVKKGNIDYSKMPSDIDMEQFRKPNISYWRLTH